MNTSKYHGKDFLKKFLLKYKSFPCLWQLDHIDYNNDDRKTLALNALVVILREVEPQAIAETVLNKLEIMKTNFWRHNKRLELLKKLENKESIPNVRGLWYYELLDFLKNQETSPHSISAKGIELLAATKAVDNITLKKFVHANPMMKCDDIANEFETPRVVIYRQLFKMGLEFENNQWVQRSDQVIHSH